MGQRAMIVSMSKVLLGHMMGLPESYRIDRVSDGELEHPELFEMLIRSPDLPEVMSGQQLPNMNMHYRRISQACPECSSEHMDVKVVDVKGDVVDGWDFVNNRGRP